MLPVRGPGAGQPSGPHRGGGARARPLSPPQPLRCALQPLAASASRRQDRPCACCAPWPRGRAGTPAPCGVHSPGLRRLLEPDRQQQHWAGSPGSRPGGLLAPGRPKLSKAIYTRTSGHIWAHLWMSTRGPLRPCAPVLTVPLRLPARWHVASSQGLLMTVKLLEDPVQVVLCIGVLC